MMRTKGENIRNDHNTINCSKNINISNKTDNKQSCKITNEDEDNKLINNNNINDKNNNIRNNHKDMSDYLLAYRFLFVIIIISIQKNT